jgi:hypothetical protein
MDDETTPHFVRSFVRRWEEEDSVNPLYLRRQQNPAHLLPTWLAPCSGLPVMRYGVDALSAVCGPAFDLVDTRRYVHTTPRGICAVVHVHDAPSNGPGRPFRSSGALIRRALR